MIPADKLRPFEGHPYKVLDNDGMNELTASIQENGILIPLMVRPIENTDGEYEIISGHRRCHAARKLGLTEVPCTVRCIDRDSATLLMIESNSQRTELLPSEKAFAYKLRAEVLSRQSRDVGPVVPLKSGGRTKAAIDDENGESYKTVQRYIRLRAFPVSFVHTGKIGANPCGRLLI